MRNFILKIIGMVLLFCLLFMMFGCASTPADMSGSIGTKSTPVNQDTQALLAKTETNTDDHSEVYSDHSQFIVQMPEFRTETASNGTLQEKGIIGIPENKESLEVHFKAQLLAQKEANATAVSAMQNKLQAEVAKVEVMNKWKTILIYCVSGVVGLCILALIFFHYKRAPKDKRNYKQIKKSYKKILAENDVSEVQRIRGMVKDILPESLYEYLED